jgi:hypothetical protein
MQIKELIKINGTIIILLKLSQKEDNTILNNIVESLCANHFCQGIICNFDYPIKKDLTLIITPDKIEIKL